MKYNTGRLEKLDDYGYHWFGMYPINYDEYKHLLNEDVGVYRIYDDDTEGLVEEWDRDKLTEEDFDDYIFAIEICDTLYQAYCNEVNEDKVKTGNDPVCLNEFIDNELYELDIAQYYLTLANN